MNGIAGGLGVSPKLKVGMDLEAGVVGNDLFVNEKIVSSKTASRETYRWPMYKCRQRYLLR